MKEAPHGIEEYLEHCFATFVKPLITEFGLRVEERELHDLGGLYQLSAGVIAIRLVNDRGLASFDIASRGRSDWYDVELVSGLFREASDHRNGTIRLNLEEQSALLRTRWSDLQHLFSWPRVLFTRRRLAQLESERVKRMFPGLGV